MTKNKKDKTFGFKCTDEDHLVFEEAYQQSGFSSKDEWIKNLLQRDTLISIRDSNQEYKEDLTELEIHTIRIYELVANMIERAEHLKDSAVKELEKKLDSKEFTIASLQEMEKNLRHNLKETAELTENQVKEIEGLNKQLEDLRSINETNQDLIQEYKEKIDTLSSLIDQYKGYAEENKILKENFSNEKEAMLSEFSEKEQRLISANEELKITLDNLNEEISKKETEIEALKANHANELNKMNLERERAILELERNHQEQLQKIRDDYNEKILEMYKKFEDRPIEQE